MSVFNVHTLDLRFQGVPQIIAAFLIENAGDLALVETGPGSTLPILLQAIETAGFSPSDVRKVFVTHAHLDHAGAVGWWSQQGAMVYAHPRAVPHLTDPTRLLESARRVYGDRMDTLWGEMLPGEPGKVVALEDGDSVAVGDIMMTALDTPGHARHHHAFAYGNVCFTGDTAGMRLPGCAYLSVTSAPPQFDPVAYESSVLRLQSMGFEKLYLTHFGEVTDVESHLTRYAERVKEVHAKVCALTESGFQGMALQDAYRDAEKTCAENEGDGAAWSTYEAGNPCSMGADGIALYVNKSRAK